MNSGITAEWTGRILPRAKMLKYRKQTVPGQLGERLQYSSPASWRHTATAATADALPLGLRRLIAHRSADVPRAPGRRGVQNR